MCATVGRHHLTGAYTLDPTATRIRFAARHSIGPTVHGRFPRVDGVGRLDADHPPGSRVELTVDATRIETGNSRRDEQVRAAFLDCEQHPTVSFVSTAVESRAGGAYRVLGHVGIRGQDRPVTLDFEQVRHDAAEIRFSASTVVSRRDWGAVWSSVWDGLVADRVRVEIEVSLRPEGTACHEEAA